MSAECPPGSGPSRHAAAPVGEARVALGWALKPEHAGPHVGTPSGVSLTAACRTMGHVWLGSEVHFLCTEQHYLMGRP